MKTPQKIVDEANQLARLFYASRGCEVPDDFKFYEARHPAEEGCWVQACIAYEHIEGTDVADALNELEIENEE